MASLTPSVGKATGLLKSAASLSQQIATYEDSLQAFQYANSAFTDNSFTSYRSYLQGRIDSLTTAGGVTNAQKALTLTRALDSAGKSNISASIQRENIQVMAGNATLTDKYNVIVGQYQRAASNGDLTLAQSLMGQAYSVSQSIQFQAQAASDAAKTLQNAKVSYQGEVVTSLDNGLKELNGAAKNLSENDFNAYAQQYVKQNADNLKALGVVLPNGAQPNYFNIVQGVVGAKYNALVLKAQAEAPLNPQTAQNYAYDAQFLNDGTSKISTLGGSLTIQEINQAANDPAMFAYDTATGSYKRTTQTGYQYLNGQVAPTYSGIASQNISNKFYFLTPQETTTMTKLGLNFSMNTSGKNAGTTGDGIQVQATQDTPNWLKAILGKNDVTNFFTESNGNLSFKSGNSYYTLASNANGLAGLFEHSPDGSLKLAGGDYGFDAGAASLLISRGQQIQQQITATQNAQAAALKLATPPPLQPLSVAPPPAAAHLNVVPAAPVLRPVTVNPQRTANPQTTAPGSNLQGGSVPLQGGSFNLNQSGSGGIRLGNL